jgi:glycine cleavage system H lipoate-binding protein
MRRATLDALERAFFRVADASIASRASSSRARPFGTVRFTRTHEIIRERNVALDGATTYEIGMAERAFDIIGDVRAIETRRAVGERARAGETLLEITWRGFRRTASDELYHARWANAEGKREIPAPFDCVVREINADAVQDPYGNVRGPETTLIVVEAREGAGARLMDDEAYETFVEAEEIAEADAANQSYP